MDQLSVHEPRERIPRPLTPPLSEVVLGGLHVSGVSPGSERSIEKERV